MGPLLHLAAAPDATAAGGVLSLSWLLYCLPAASAVVLGLVGRRGDKWGHLLGCATPIASFVLGVAMFVELVRSPVAQRSISTDLFTWVPLPAYHITFGTQLDQLSMTFVLLITGVGSIIHVYSIGYMAHDYRRRRFFAFLNLFVASMLLLVVANDYLVMFVGWEFVGLSSYLLIGFWQHRDIPATAAKKAFVVNRVGDIGFQIAIMVMLATFGTSSFAGVNAGAGKVGTGTATAIGLLLLLAACGKSAQVPLQSWLLDAMEGPTPVSALIHAATMVTAGVYLVTRAHLIFNQAPWAQHAVVIVAVVTILWGAVIGSARDDIKRGLAGSTMSQIGYMLLGAGLGPIGYAFGIFHLVAHGFFKANLFLSTGSIMHGMKGEVNMRWYGGLHRFFPITFITFACGYLAIIGIPPFAGFFSKDKVIDAAFAQNIWAGLGALIGAGVTAFYMSRMMLMTFHGRRRWKPGQHPHESPRVMTSMLVILAFLSLAGGFGLLYFGGSIVSWLQPLLGHQEVSLAVPEWGMSLITLVIVLIGVGIAWAIFGRRPVPVEVPHPANQWLKAARADLYGDAFNEAVFMRPGIWLIRQLTALDERGIDGFVNGVAHLTTGVGAVVRRVQTGFVRSYALVFLGGASLVVFVLVLVRL